MRNLIHRVSARDHLHRPVGFIARRQCHPGGHDIWLAQAPISRILMPRHESRVPGFLDEEIRRPAQQFTTIKVLDCIQDLLVAHEVGKPGEKQMGLVPQIAAEGTSGAGLELLEPLADTGCFGFRHNANWREIPFLLETLDLAGRQELRHRTLLLYLRLSVGIARPRSLPFCGWPPGSHASRDIVLPLASPRQLQPRLAFLRLMRLYLGMRGTIPNVPTWLVRAGGSQTGVVRQQPAIGEARHPLLPMRAIRRP